MRRGTPRGTRGVPALQWGARTQDHMPLDVQIERIAEETVLEALAETTEQLDAIEQELETGVGVRSMLVDLPGGYSGTVILERPFAEVQVGAPVIVSQSGELEEFVLATFVARVLDTRRMQVRYVSSSPAPRRVRLNFIIGVRG